MLNSARIVNFDSMAFRFPTAPDFEEYLKRSTRMKAAYREDSGRWWSFSAQGFCPGRSTRLWRTQGLRKLYGLSVQVAKRHLERLAGVDGEIKVKVTLSTSQELEDKAVDTGMPEPHSDRDRPSLHSHAHVQPRRNFPAHSLGKPLPLRDDECPEGTPEVVARLPYPKRRAAA